MPWLTPCWAHAVRARAAGVPPFNVDFAAQGWTNCTLISHKRVDSRFLVLPGSESIFTEITEYIHFTLIFTPFEFKFSSDEDIVPLVLIIGLVAFLRNTFYYIPAVRGWSECDFRLSLHPWAEWLARAILILNDGVIGFKTPIQVCVCSKRHNTIQWWLSGAPARVAKVRTLNATDNGSVYVLYVTVVETSLLLPCKSAPYDSDDNTTCCSTWSCNVRFASLELWYHVVGTVLAHCGGLRVVQAPTADMVQTETDRVVPGFASYSGSFLPGHFPRGRGKECIEVNESAWGWPLREASANITVHSSILGHRNWQTETAVWNLAGFLHCAWVCGKRRGFSPGAAARHSQSARVHTDSRHTGYQFIGLSFRSPSGTGSETTCVPTIPGMSNHTWRD